MRLVLKKCYCKILIFFLLSSVTAHAQYVQYTYHDDDKQQIKEIYHVNDTITNTLEGRYQSYYINGNIESTGHFTNNETFGVWEFYYEDGKVKMRGDLQQGSSDGFWEYFFESGSKSMEGNIISKKREGQWKIFYEGGDLKEVGSFSEGRREGDWVYFFEDGRIKGEINYNYGKGRFTEYYPTGEVRAEGPKSGAENVGIWKYYYKDGTLQAEGKYETDEKSGLWKYFYHNGQVSAVGSFDNNKPSGDWNYYYEDGTVSSKGSFAAGKKDGEWLVYYSDGTLKGKSQFDEGSGLYRELYKSGNTKLQGRIVDGQYEGHWSYYYETGELEGECDYVEGRGIYHGYYTDGSLQTKGSIHNGKKVGKWDLYKNDGTLTGYYRPVYDERGVKRVKVEKIKETKKYGVAEYRFRGRKKSHFEPRRNEFKGIIVGTNPLEMFINRLPLALEFYMQERLGYEFEFEGIRDPFFGEDGDVPLNETYKRGYSAALRQKFYNPQRYGMWYFGHEIRFTNMSHYVNLPHSTQPESVVRASAKEQKYEYSGVLGYRLMQSTSDTGFTADAFVSLGAGYRSFDQKGTNEKAFSDLHKGDISFAYNFGLNLGYTFPFRIRR